MPNPSGRIIVTPSSLGPSFLGPPIRYPISVHRVEDFRNDLCQPFDAVERNARIAESDAAGRSECATGDGAEPSHVDGGIDDPEVVTVAKRDNSTRAAAAVSQARELLHGGLAVIGNAPTAIIELVRLHKQGILQPALVVGMPVGFVNAAEAKEMLMASGLVYISVAGRKGGSAVAAAAVNALANLAAKESKAQSA